MVIATSSGGPMVNPVRIVAWFLPAPNTNAGGFFALILRLI
jgi:hypothetical protein